MRHPITTAPLVVLVAFASLGFANATTPTDTAPHVTTRAEAHRAFHHANAEELDNARRTLIAGRDLTDAQRALVDEADRLAAQKDSLWSGLYWHTDLDTALAHAKRENKPVLSLRLLGRLDDGLSCANSRFFRVALYANRSISDHLLERFILHWQSERPVPKVAIDYGDGRVVRTTITGNSIHYVLSPRGAVVDALPGLYTPGQFGRFLGAAAQAALAPRPLADRDAAARNASSDHWRLPNDARVAPPAERALPIAMSKAIIEAPLVEATTLWNDGVDWPADDERWDQLARAYRRGASLDASSRTLVRAHKPGLSEPKLDAMIARFEQAMALDTARNERLVRPRLLDRVAEDSRRSTDLIASFDRLNRWVYDELFLTPAADPWLGLFRPEEVFDGLPADLLSTSD